MPKDWQIDYYGESLSIAADEMGLVLTPQQIDGLAEAVIGSIENEGMACGRDCIPNPMVSEITELKRQHAAELVRRDKVEQTLIKGLARRLHVDADKLSANASGQIFHSDGRTEEIYP